MIHEYIVYWVQDVAALAAVHRLSTWSNYKTNMHWKEENGRFKVQQNLFLLLLRK